MSPGCVLRPYACHSKLNCDVTGLLDAYTDCTFNRPILAYEPIQSA